MESSQHEYKEQSPLLQIQGVDGGEEKGKPSGAPNKKWSWKSLIVAVCLWLAYLFVSSAYSLLGPFFPDEAAIKGATPTIVGVITSVSPLCVVVLSPLLGYYLPQLGLKFTMLAGLFLVGGAFVLLGFVAMMPSGWIFILFCVLLRMTEGIGSAMFITATFTLLPELYPNKVGTVMGVFEVSGGLGFVIGPPIGGVLYKVGGFKLPFIVVGGLVMLFVVPSYLLIRHSSCNAVKLPLNTLWKLLTNFVIFVLVLANILSLASISFFTPTMEPFLKKEFGLDPLHVALVFLSGPATYMVFSLIVGPITDKLGERYFIFAGFILFGFGYFFIGPADFVGSPRVWITCVAFAVIGVGAAFGTIPIYSDMLAIGKKGLSPGEDTESLNAVLSGVVSSTLSLGEFVGPLIGGGFTQFFDFQTSSVLFGEVLLAEGFLILGVTVIDVYCERRRTRRSNFVNL